MIKHDTKMAKNLNAHILPTTVKRHFFPVAQFGSFEITSLVNVEIDFKDVANKTLADECDENQKPMVSSLPSKARPKPAVSLRLNFTYFSYWQ